MAEKAGQSSTWRELTAVLHVLEAVAKKLSGTWVHWFSDNQNVVGICHVGCKKPHLQCGSTEGFCPVSLFPGENRSRMDSHGAAFKSQLVEPGRRFNDWIVNPAVFFELDRLWGPHTID